MRSIWARVLAVCVLLLGLAGCHSGGDLYYIRPGATRAEVYKALGLPASSSASNNVELLRYELLTAQANKGGGDAAAQVESYYIRIIDGTVESYGKWSDLPAQQKKLEP